MSVLKRRSGRPQRVSVTSLPPSPEEERRTRFLKYTIAMLIRAACLLLAAFVDGPIRWVAAAGAVLLPYFAVVIGNAVQVQESTQMQPASPELLALVPPGPDTDKSSAVSQEADRVKV